MRAETMPAPPPKSALFDLVRTGWPNRPYPLLVDHADHPEGRVCPAASLYAHGKVMSDALLAVELEPGEVVACLPRTWIEWVGMLQGCLRRGAIFAPRSVRSPVPPEAWCRQVEACVVLESDRASRRPTGRRGPPNGLVVGPPAVALEEAEILEATDPRADPLLEPQGPVWLDDRTAPIAEALAMITLLRAQAELHVGLAFEEAVHAAEDHHRLVDGSGPSFSFASVRSWQRSAQG